MFPIISSNDLRRLLEASTRGKDECEVSLDLGLTKCKVKVLPEGFIVDSHTIVIPKIRDSDKSCYIIDDDFILQKVQIFSPETNKLYKLIPTTNKPLLQVSGTSMHKREFVDRVEKAKLKGRVLDAGTGLGYTASVVAKSADEVFSFEVDENVLTLAEYNPWSHALFDNAKIHVQVGDVVDEIKKFEDESFDAIVFDAGTPHASGDFFSSDNYQQAARVIRKGGLLLHYLPRVHEKRGRDFPGEIMNRLVAAGFRLMEESKDGCFVIMKKE